MKHSLAFDLTAYAILASIVCIAVGLRLWCRAIARCSLVSSDYLAVSSVVIILGYWATGTYRPFPLLIVAYSMAVIDSEAVAQALVSGHAKPGKEGKARLALYVLWLLGCYSCKMAILCLYDKLFATRTMRKLNQALAVFTFLCGALSLLGLFVALDSVDVWWSDRKKNEGEKARLFAWSLFADVATIVTDCAIFALPLRMLHNLHMQPQRRDRLVASFALGFLTCVYVLGRTIALYKLDTDKIHPNVACMLNGLEPTLGIILACLPTLQPLLNRSSRRSSRQSDTDTPSELLHNKNRAKLAFAARKADHKRQLLESSELSSTCWSEVPRSSLGNEVKVEASPRPVHFPV